MQKLLLATHNPGKRREWQALLHGLPLEILLPDDVGVDAPVEETGETYLDNARLKARALAGASGLPTLADDSGLEVNALEGAPGVRSARYKLGSDTVRYRALLAALEGVAPAQRGARFRCVAVLILPDGREFITEGVCEGRIGDEAQGGGGFGYDPVFWLEERDCTMAELPAEAKNRLSHRARAAQALRPILERELLA